MNARILLFIFLLPSLELSLIASSVDATVSQHAMESMSIQEPSEESPFFLERQEARQALAEAATDSRSMYPILPPRPSAQKQVGQFFHSLVRSIKWNDRKKSASMDLIVEPTSFSVADISELNVTFKIFNNKKTILIMEFPTNQRFEILVKEPDGHIIYRWSEDRSFDQVLGTVIIDMGESIAYTEKIPTAAMKNGTTYTIEATLLGQPGYTITQQITPREISTVMPEESDRSYLDSLQNSKGLQQQLALPGLTNQFESNSNTSKK